MGAGQHERLRKFDSIAQLSGAENGPPVLMDLNENRGSQGALVKNVHGAWTFWV